MVFAAASDVLGSTWVEKDHGRIETRRCYLALRDKKTGVGQTPEDFYHSKSKSKSNCLAVSYPSASNVQNPACNGTGAWACRLYAVVRL